MRIAVVDLGTNTCNLLVAECLNSNYEILHQSKQLVKLGDDKIKDNEISNAATGRTINAFRKHKKVVEHFGVERVSVIATSAVRTADNKIDFLTRLSDEIGWLIKVVSGEQEAELIFKGVLLAFCTLEKTTAILDIGGGSNEIILAKEQKLLWKESRPAGMSRVINHFKLSDPINSAEIDTLRLYFKAQHQQAIDYCKQHEATMLVGCSGAFDTIVDIIDAVEPETKQRVKQEISLDDFYRVSEKLFRLKREERRQVTGMDNMRVDLIVPALILVDTLIRETGIKKIVQTDFALREGVVYEQMKTASLGK